MKIPFTNSYVSFKPQLPFEKKSRTIEKDVIVFTTHKAGSMVLHRVLLEICNQNSIAYYSPNQDPDKQVPFERIFNGEDFIAGRSGCFGPLRFFVPSASLENSNIIVHLRDPRDVLTSMFFSYCFMHSGDVAADTGYRKEVAEAGIDKFVLDLCDENFARYQGDYGTGGQFGKYIGNIRDRYMTYLKEVISRPNAIVLSYEEMVLDFPGWLRKFLAAFELSDPDRTYESVRSRIEIQNDVTRAAKGRSSQTATAGGEDIRAHRRKATPGDYKEKLRPETISELNRRFGDVLDALGYSGSQYQASQIPALNNRG